MSIDIDGTRDTGVIKYDICIKGGIYPEERRAL